MQTVFFWLSKLGWIFISPINLIFLLMVYTWIQLLSNKQKAARSLFTILVILMIIISIFPVGDMLIRPLENRFKTNPVLPEKIEGIIVLGGSLNPVLSYTWNQVEMGGSIERELMFMHLGNLYPNVTLVYTGGSASLLQQDKKEADVAEVFFKQMNFDTSSIFFERNSRNSYENMIFSLAKVKPKMKMPWILITSAYHMPRAVGIFCKQGWPVLPYPVDHLTQKDTLFQLNFNLTGYINHLDLAIHEWLGLYIYYITGKTSAIFPDQCNN